MHRFFGDLPLSGKIFFPSLEFSGENFRIRPFVALGYTESLSNVVGQTPCLQIFLSDKKDRSLFLPIHKAEQKEHYFIDFSDWPEGEPYLLGDNWGGDERSSIHIQAVEPFRTVMKQASFGWFFVARFADRYANAVPLSNGKAFELFLQTASEQIGFGLRTTGYHGGRLKADHYTARVESQINLQEAKKILTAQTSIVEIVELYEQKGIIDAASSEIFRGDLSGSLVGQETSTQDLTKQQQAEMRRSILCSTGEWVRPVSLVEDVEVKAHTIHCTRPFYVDAHPVTQALWDSLMQSNPSSFRHPHHPVTNLTPLQAVQFCNALSRKHKLESVYRFEGQTVHCNIKANGYRLPTEAEWERAASIANQTGKNRVLQQQNAYIFTHSFLARGETGQVSSFGELYELTWGFSAKKMEDSYLSFAKQGSVTDPSGPSKNAPLVWKGEGLFTYNNQEFERLGFRLARTAPQEMWESTTSKDPLDELLAATSAETELPIFTFPEVVNLFLAEDLATIKKTLKSIENWIHKGRTFHFGVTYIGHKGSIGVPKPLAKAKHRYFITLSLLALEIKAGMRTASEITFFDFEDKDLHAVPDCLASFPELKELNFRNNPISQLPDYFSTLSKLEKLDCYFTEITDIPLSFAPLFQQIEIRSGRIRFNFRFTGPSSMKGNLGLLQLLGLCLVDRSVLTEVQKHKIKTADWERLSSEQQKHLTDALQHAALRFV